MIKYYGKCYCGNVEFSCEGEPFFTQHCHCKKCREIASLSRRSTDKHGYAYTAAYLTARFKILRGEDTLEEIIRGTSKLILCNTCHSLICGISLDPQKQEGIGINVNNFHFLDKPPASFKPVRHIWYADRIIDIQDDLPKYKDAPEDQFGTGELCS